MDGVAVLQVGWFIDSVPPWFAPLLVYVGIGIIVGWRNLDIANEFTNYFPANTDPRHVLAAAACFTIAVLFILYANFDAISPYYAGAAAFAGRWIEGAAAARLFAKISNHVPGRGAGTISTAGSGRVKPYLAKGIEMLLSRFGKRLAFAIFGFLAVILGGWVVLWHLATKGDATPLIYNIAFAWTVAAVLAALLGMGRRFWPIRGEVSGILTLGVLLAVAGAAIFNYNSLGQNIVVYFVGNVGYAVGFVVAITFAWSGSLNL